MTLTEQARRLSAATGYTVEAHPYDIGYFRRVAGESKPRSKEGREGWRTADEELREERDG